MRLLERLTVWLAVSQRGVCPERGARGESDERTVV